MIGVGSDVEAVEELDVAILRLLIVVCRCRESIVDYMILIVLVSKKKKFKPSSKFFFNF